MPVTRTAALAGIVLLLALWLGPLPALAQHSFAAHMALHMGVVAIAAPLLVLATGSALERRGLWPGLPILASMIELVIVWGWHAPALHQAARHETWALVLEQGSFLFAGLLLWGTALSSDPRQPRLHAACGMVALLFTSMHMTLLGALFALGTRPLFRHGGSVSEAAALADQHLGGAIMLLVGGAAYLAGGLWLTARLLRSDSPRATPGGSLTALEPIS